jgi:predicted Rossmann fold flavoprotein
VSSTKFDVVVIGGGAAGLFCAIKAGRRGRKVLVIERNAQVGRKIIISGGGRCNFTNLHVSPDNFVSQNPHFAKSALARYTPDDFIRLVRKHKIDFYEKKLGQLFCRESSRQIVDMLLKECMNSRVEIRTSCAVTRVEHAKGFQLDTTRGRIDCACLVIASGGLSFPKVGATDFGYAVARQFGLTIIPTRPSLVPLVLDGQHPNRKLAGISVDALVTADTGPSFRENILFTHRGLSGPAILQISNYWRRKSPVTIDLIPETNLIELLLKNQGGRLSIEKFLSQFVPERVAEAFTPARWVRRPISQIGRSDVEMIVDPFKWSVLFRETEGYDKAEVTIGGVSTAELSSTTMEAKSVPGLFFIGEVVDVTGWLGGYNFQWAWASGHAAGEAV